MESLICANPLRISTHYRRKSASIGIQVIDKSFCEMYISICENLKEGMKLCKQCRDIVEKSTPAPLKCVDPLQVGEHLSKDFCVVSVDTQRMFYPLRNKLPLGATLCSQCHEKLKQITKNKGKPLVAEIPNICCNPLEKPDHSTGKKFRIITQNMMQKFSSDSVFLFVNDKICSTCRAELYRSEKKEKMQIDFDDAQSSNNNSRSPTSFSNSLEDSPMNIGSNKNYEDELIDGHMDSEESSGNCELDSDDTFGEKLELLALLNNTLKTLNLDPVISISGANLVKKYQEAKTQLKTLMQKLTKSTLNFEEKCGDCESLVQGAQIKFPLATRSEKYRILTALPTKVSTKSIVKIFGCSKYMAQKAKILRENNGPFSTPVFDMTNHLRISDETRNNVCALYRDPEFSRSLPGKRDTLLVKNPTKAGYELKGKYRLLRTIPELYEEFQKRYPDINISLSSFQILRPFECIPVGRGVYHNTCTCVIHENFDLLLNALGNNLSLQELFEKMTCNQYSEKCMMGFCPLCPKYSENANLFNEIDTAEEIVYCQWKQTDGTELVQIREILTSFKANFNASLPKLMCHHFLVREQNVFVRKWKEDHKSHPTECLVNVDFAQNYEFVQQDEIQSAHWGHPQATVHPFYIDYTCKDTMELKHLEYIIISDDLQHNTVAYHTFQKYVISELKKKLPHISTIRYLSDGSSAQYKNYKNILNMLFHESDFGLKATLEFYPTAHGKGNCDRLSAVAKQTVERDSLRKFKGQQPILTPLQMFEHLSNKNNITTRNYLYVTKEQVRANYMKLLKSRFIQAKTVPGTRDYHSFTPISGTSFEARRYTLQSVGTIIDFEGVRTHDININDFIVVKVNQRMEIGMVTDLDAGDVIVKFFQQSEHNNKITLSWPAYPRQQNVIPADVCFKITSPKATTRSGRIYNLAVHDYKKIKDYGVLI